MLTDAPGISRVIGKCLELCGDLPLLGHKILVDYSFLKKAAVNEGMEFEKQGIDTLKLCRKFMPAVEKKNLSSACAYYKPLIYKIKREQPATKRQKEVLRELLKYHKISVTVQIDHLSRNEISRLTDKIILQYGRMSKR